MEAEAVGGYRSFWPQPK